MKNKPSILLIDDEKDILNLLTYILRSEGFHTETAVSAAEAFNKIMKGSYSGVVCDLKMPEIDGISLLKMVRAETNLLPFIFLSGYAGVQDEFEMINYGAYELINKPDIKKVPDSLRSLLNVNQEVKNLKESGEEALEFLEILHETKKGA